LASYQRIALFILFDSIESDLIQHIRHIAGANPGLTAEESDKARTRLLRKAGILLDPDNPYDLVYGLDLLEKFQVLMRNKAGLDAQALDYFKSISSQVARSIGVRNDIMHGRPLTVDEHIFAFSFAQGLLSKGGYWPNLRQAYLEYANSPTAFVQRSIQFLDEPPQAEVLHNLPPPDYDDTGFLSRSTLERDLKKKILGRHPVITVLGEGGNGKTALALQVLYGLVRSNDHGFDAILWVSSKISTLGVSGIQEMQEVAVAATEVMDAAAALEAAGATPRERLYKMLRDNKILLVIDNYETIVGSDIAEFAEDVPGESKLLFTSRLPVGPDLTVLVSELSEHDALVYFYRLVDAYAVDNLKGKNEDLIKRWLNQLSYKPLLIKWLVLGVQSGLQPDRIAANPEAALRFCLDNVILTLGPEAQAVLFVLATLPSPPGAGVIQHVSELKATQIGDGLAQLSRFGLIEANVTEEQGLLYSIKSFSRNYILRIITPKPAVTDRIIRKYRDIEADYQNERTRSINHYYSFKNYKIRSRSEMLIARKLREASSLAARGDFVSADGILLEAKLTDPSYFESYRIESFVAQQQNDIPRALAAYQAAIKLAPEELQLHFFYAGLLMRIGERDLAAEEFDLALEGAVNNGLVWREAARNEMMRHQWSRAQELLTHAFELRIKEHRENIKLTDLQIQLFVRKIEAECRADQLHEAISTVKLLDTYLSNIESSSIDNITISHLSKVLPWLRDVRAGLGESFECNQLAERIYRDYSINKDLLSPS
jgi:LuxR family glucitol operon transcriptional activator